MMKNNKINTFSIKTRFMTLKLKPENMNDITIQFRVFDNLFASACMQYATSALGRITDVAENISIQEKKKI